MQSKILLSPKKDTMNAAHKKGKKIKSEKFQFNNENEKFQSIYEILESLEILEKVEGKNKIYYCKKTDIKSTREKINAIQNVTNDDSSLSLN